MKARPMQYRVQVSLPSSLPGACWQRWRTVAGYGTLDEAIEACEAVAYGRARVRQGERTLHVKPTLDTHAPAGVR